MMSVTRKEDDWSSGIQSPLPRWFSRMVRSPPERTTVAGSAETSLTVMYSNFVSVSAPSETRTVTV